MMRYRERFPAAGIGAELMSGAAPYVWNASEPECCWEGVVCSGVSPAHVTELTISAIRGGVLIPGVSFTWRTLCK